MTLDQVAFLVLALAAVLLVVFLLQRLLRLALYAGIVFLVLAGCWAAFDRLASDEVKDTVGAAGKDVKRQADKLMKQAERQGTTFQRKVSKDIVAIEPAATAVRKALREAGSGAKSALDGPAGAGAVDLPPGGAALDGPAGTEAAGR